MTNILAKRILFWLGLVIAPVVLVAIELFHPANFTQEPGMFAYLCVPQPFETDHRALAYFGPRWWVTLHMIQLPMLGLVSVGLWGLMDDVDGGLAGALAWLSRILTFIFMVLYTALDSIGGIGLGRSILNVEAMQADGRLTPDEVMGAIKLLNTDWVDPLTGGVGSFISLGGSWAILGATLTGASALALAARAPWPALVLLVAFGWQIQVSHASPHGPIGFTLLLLSALWIAWSRRKLHSRADIAAVAT
ncbi:hypothetical protein GCM10007301_22200 [Azorhizobium oxalatiphilum]|uniref:Uncharacterized protein n=1 Tax=Azorhizobium oxalatiphilum TaxID=980631 RepID=A0A917FB15_9HYPH|nr:hypothetical protein [Azorhizobium oxalatiphilum]GGF62025.1 hypothetical protein GCM10007301_22200 [Azorhizobium oxalatiphilum]